MDTVFISKEHTEHEELVRSLLNPDTLADYKSTFDNYKPSLLPRLLGGLLVFCGNVVYGHKPSYLKFRAVEVIARVPYHSWASAAFTLLTMFYTDEERALELSKAARFARFASDNETMHVVVISALTEKEHRAGFVRHTLIPMIFAFFYFWMSYLLYLMCKRWSLETNYLFEQHAFDQYSIFLEENAAELKAKPIESEFLSWYGRTSANQYDFFFGVRNDEIIHRNESIEKITQS